MRLTNEERVQLQAKKYAIYTQIFALPTPEQRWKALKCWYNALEQTCSEEHKCIECKLEQDSH